MSNEKELYLIILYYKYIHIEEPKHFKNLQIKYCSKLNLLGRIIVSSEGINGTLSGSKESILEYIKYLKKTKGFENIDFKISTYYKHVFSKLSVKVRKEIVALKLKKDIFPEYNSNNYLEPKKFFQMLKEKDVVVLDVRNDYEYDLGHFRNSINPKISNFRDFPEWLDKNLSFLKNKKILTYCTGGVRCEKASILLRSKQINEVYQLKGGIINYSQDPETKGKLFDGKVYVFDQRIADKVNQTEHIIVGKDFFNQTPCERYINCGNPSCNKQILCNEENEKKYLGSCSESCSKNENNRYLLKNKN
ncbi:rhodanese-related sulfurtransferase [Candidatus Phytoplasma fraxini]|uniref:tRNA uridine(34) hydroxylase n=1 Tax=Ash yellows phytoplasma TaxID=35780 RepID=A0ABZ2UD85_ASHYP